MIQTGSLRLLPSRDGLFGLLLVVATFLAYLPALRGGFVWDDDAYVTHNPLLTEADGFKQIWFSRHMQSQYFPLVFTALRLEYALWGLNPIGYHIVNVLLHAANALLVWAVLRRMSVPGAWLAAALWALHPVQVESVAWITELKNTQSTLFYLSALLSWLKFADQRTAVRWQFYSLALLLYAMALFSKTTACTLPAALLLVLWWRGESIGWRRIAQVLPFLFMGLAMGLVSVWWEGHLGNYREESGTGFGWLERLLIASRALWFYAGKLLWPAALTFSYPKWEINVREPMQYAWLAGCSAIALLLWWRRKRLGRGVIAAVAFYVATLLPLLGFIWLYTFRYSFVADHYQYVASAGLLALAGAASCAAFSRLGKGKPFLQPAVSGVLLLALGVLTWRQCGMYSDMETLWRTTIARNPASWLAHNNLGNTLLDKGQVDEAIARFERALEIHPDYALAHYNLGTALFRTGHTDDAIAHFKRVLEIEPDNAADHGNLGNALAQMGRMHEALTHYERAFQLVPTNALVANNLAWFLATCPEASIRNGARAVELARQAVHLSGGNKPMMIGTLAAAFAEAGRFDEAVSTGEIARSLAQATGETELAAKNAQLLELYRAAKPYRETTAPEHLR